MNLRILFCDDDREIMQQLYKMVLGYFESTNQPKPECVLCNSGEELLATGAVGDIAFLDVEMDGLSGIHTGERLKKINPRIKVIIVTSYPDYLDEAMKFHVFRYLSKPVDKQRLFRNLKDALYQINTYSKPVVIETFNDCKTIDAEDIICFESDKRQTIIHTVQGKVFGRQGIDYWTKSIDIPSFFAVSRSFIVNMKYVSSFNNEIVRLTNGQLAIDAYLARRRFKAFRDAYMLYMRSVQ